MTSIFTRSVTSAVHVVLRRLVLFFSFSVTLMTLCSEVKKKTKNKSNLSQSLSFFFFFSRLAPHVGKISRAGKSCGLASLRVARFEQRLTATVGETGNPGAGKARVISDAVMCVSLTALLVKSKYSHSCALKPGGRKKKKKPTTPFCDSFRNVTCDISATTHNICTNEDSFLKASSHNYVNVVYGINVFQEVKLTFASLFGLTEQMGENVFKLCSGF